MKLLLDIGNTAVKWAFAAGRTLAGQGGFVHRDGNFRELADRAWSTATAPEAVFAVNVAGAGLASALSEYLQAAWQLEPEFVQVSAADCGVTNAYSTPGDLGADRWVAMIAAHRLSDGAVCVVDCGTAVTLDVVMADGRHRGGLILPGMAMLCESLQVNTAGIEMHDDVPASGVLALGTRAGVEHGARILLASAIDRIVSELAEQGGEMPDVILTGGDAEQLLPLLGITVQHVPGLVLQGLAIMSEGRS